VTEPKPESSPARTTTDWSKLLTGITALVGATATLLAAANTFVGLNRKTAAPIAATAASTQTPVPTPPLVSAQTVAPAVTGAQSLILMEDSFGGSQTGWDIGQDSDAEWGYDGGKYIIVVRSPELFIWANPTKRHDWANLVLVVEAQRLSGPLDNEYGVLVRYVDRGNFYYFGVSSDGHYVVQMLHNDEWTTLVPWTASEHVKMEAGTNLLRVECQGPRMRFFVNDKLLTAVEDKTFLSGSVGLAAGTMSEPGVAVGFDNLLVRALPEE